MSWSTSELRVRLACRETGLNPPVKYFTDRSKAVLLLWIFYVLFLSCACYAFVWVCSWLSFVVSSCEFVTFLLVSWVRRGTWLYRFLIFAPLLTSITRHKWLLSCAKSPNQVIYVGTSSDSTSLYKAYYLETSALEALYECAQCIANVDLELKCSDWSELAHEG